MEARTYILISVMVIMVMVAAYSINVVYAQQKPQIIQAIPGTLIYVPSGPNFNPYAPSNIVGSVATCALSLLQPIHWPILPRFS